MMSIGSVTIKILAQHGDSEPTEIGTLDVPVQYIDGEVKVGSIEQALTDHFTNG